MAGRVWADRGHAVELAHGGNASDAQASWVGVSRLGTLRVASPMLSVWLQLRGSCRVNAVEGDFVLNHGDWIVFAHDSMPRLQSERDSLTIGLTLPAGALAQMTAHQDHIPMLGRGRMGTRDINESLRLWRNTSLRATSAAAASGLDRTAARPFLLHVAHLQRELALPLSRCPGKQHRARREVFETLQRVRLHLDGNAHRIIRLTELSELTRFSSWYLSKTFHGVYGESMQSSASRYRLQRACELLEHTSLAITEIGSACGFSSIATFSRAFRTAQGMSASNYRRITHGHERRRARSTPGIDTSARRS